MAWQRDVFEMRTKCTVVAIGGRQKYNVPDGPPGDTPALAGLRVFEFFACHQPEPKTLPDAGMNALIVRCEAELCSFALLGRVYRVKTSPCM